MSLNITREVDRQHPELLRENINATCYQFVVLVIQALRAQGLRAYHVAKTAGEGQYTPPGFQPRMVAGLDGKPYRITGVSHDALWCEDAIVDTIARGNDSPDPITHPDGSHMTGVAVWNAIPPEHWRPNNPPLMDGNGPQPTPIPPTPQPPVVKTYPGDAYFIEKVGVPLEADYKSAGQTLNAGSATWFARTIFDAIAGSMTMDASVAKHRAEWRGALGLPPL